MYYVFYDSLIEPELLWVGKITESNGFAPGYFELVVDGPYTDIAEASRAQTFFGVRLGWDE